MTRMTPYTQTLLSLSCLLAMGCSTTKPAGNEPGVLRQAVDIRTQSAEECERRATAMARQSEEMREGPNPSDWKDTDGAQDRGLEGNSPCDNLPEGADTSTGDDARIRAMARARSFMEQDRPLEARRALIAAFEKGTRAEPGLRNLALDIHEALMEVEPQVEPICVLKDVARPQVRQVVTLEGSSQVMLSCRTLGSSEGSAPSQGKQVRVMLRRRDAPGKFVTLEEHEMGEVSAVTLPLERIFTLPREASSEQAVYYDFMMVVGAPGKPSERAEQVGVFWFGR